MFALTRHPSSGNGVPRRLGGALAFLALALAPGVPWGADLSPAARQDATPSVAAGTELHERRITKRVVSGDTLPRLLTDLGLPGRAKHRWLRAVSKQLGVAHTLRVGDTIHFHFLAPWASSKPGVMTGVQIERPGWKPLTWQLRHDRIVYHRNKGVSPVVAAAKPVAGSPVRPAAPKVAASKPVNKPTGTANESTKKPAVKSTSEPAAKPTAKPTAKPAARLTVVAAKAPVPAAAAVERVTHVLRKGESLERVLRGKGVSPRVAHPWIRTIGKKYRLKRLFPGRKIVLYFVADAAPAGGRALRAVQIESRGGDLLTWQRTDGRIRYRGKNHQVVVRVREAVPASKAPPAKTAPSAQVPVAAGSPSAASRPLPPTRSFEPLHKVIRTVGRGQTLGRLFRPLGVTGKEAETWFRAIDKQYPVTRLKPGQRLHLYFERTPSRHRRNNLKAVELEVRKGRRLAWERRGAKVHYGRGPVLAGPERKVQDAAPSRSNDAASAERKGSFLSEYALARIKQRNGLLEYTPPANGNGNGVRPVPPLENAERMTHRLKSGEHLWGVLRKYELDNKERQRWLVALRRDRNVRRLRTGSNINFYFKAPVNGNGKEARNGHRNGPRNGNGAHESNGHLQALEIVVRANLRLTWYRDGQDIRFYKDEVPYQQEVRSISGAITAGSLYDSARDAGIDLNVMSRMVDILAWDINFQRDLRAGDSYRVLYRRKFRPGSKASDQIRILAVEFVNQGRTHKAVYFEDEGGEGNYYDAAGHSVSRSFLRYPVEFKRISSRFSLSRFHPILRVRRPHYGVDFAARTGTPIRAVADGRVTIRGWKGAYGRVVEISHGGAVKTRYAHLRRYGPGIRRGVSVEKGQTIGYVGCSGLCTGPHLHFEMWQDNRYVDPLRVNIPVERQLDPLLMRIFDGTKKLFFGRLEADRKTAALPSPTSS